MDQDREKKRYPEIGAVVLAAGKSQRMGKPKLVLPWKGHTVIWQIVDTLSSAGVNDIIVVTGGSSDLVEKALAETAACCVHNPDYASSEMIHSLKIGLQALPAGCQALLVALGDQPFIEEAVIRRVIDTFLQTRSPLVIPSYQMRRGHPWLVERSRWQDLLAMPESQTLQDFISLHNSEITYVNVDTPSILKDIDTPEDYQKSSSSTAI